MMSTHQAEPRNERAPITDAELSSAQRGLAESVRDLLRDGKITAGFFEIQYVEKAVWSGVSIWQGFGVDPETIPDLGHDPGEPREVSWMWRAAVNGREVRLFRVWPRCIRWPITEAEYQYRVARYRWHKKFKPGSPFARPNRPVDPETALVDWKA